ncbi:LysR family transcriptional regulator [Roseibium polysiphoniae]|uniref:LysR family transcriptional regulator n=1 Tax=Roseibium polysiphoniae TaxID=2571221 RepID=A0A944CG46_9HYPH|nr:LysR family transcriptional regulator [Roseibium polysiphoniae]MBS8261631.1 LysR family transcriptional regulator [Roseibium polysiphoniae]
MDEIFSTKQGPDIFAGSNRALNLDAVRSFVAICETGTFRRAAARVNLSPSAVSLHIAKLEEQVGVRLMTRDARHIALTEQGEVMLGYGRKLLGVNSEAMAYFRGSSLAGRLRLVAPFDLGVSLVPGLLNKLAETHPAIVVDVRLETSDAVQSIFADGQAGVALFNEVEEPGLQVRELASEPLVWLMNEGGRAIERSPLPLAIAEIRCAWRRAALQALDATGVSYRVAYSSDTSAGQLAALRADLAVAALPVSLAKDGLVQVSGNYGLPKLPKTQIFLAHDGSELAQILAAKAV